MLAVYTEWQRNYIHLYGLWRCGFLDYLFINIFQFFSHCLTQNWKSETGYSVYVSCFHFVVITHSLQLITAGQWCRVSFAVKYIFQDELQARSYNGSNLLPRFSSYIYLTLPANVRCLYISSTQKQTGGTQPGLIFLSILIPISTYRNGFITIAEEFPNDR